MRLISDQNCKWWMLAAMSGVLGLTVLDETIVGVALATIRPDLGMSQIESHWVVNAYLLTFACFVAVGGRLGDIHDRTVVFVIGASIFGLASLMAGLAVGGEWLIAARAAQGIGAAITFPASLAIMTNIFPPEQRGFALGVQITISAIFMSMGPLAGGFFSETISWRWIFWINLPIVAAIVLVVIAARTKEPRAVVPTAGRFDFVGLATLVVGLTALVVALMQGTEWGWTAPATLALLGGGVVLLVLFTITETRRRDPLIEVGLLRIATFTGGNLVFFMFQFNKMVVFVFVALYLQEALGESPIDAGFALLIAVLPTLFTSLLAGKMVDRFGSRRPLAIGLLINAAALAVVAWATTYNNYTLIIIPLAFWGAMLPVIAASARRALMSAVPAAQRGQAGGINLTIQMVGGTIGMAIAGTLLATTGAYWLVFLVTSVLLFLNLVLAWLMVERPGDAVAAQT